ncbi:MAG TPA: hypothetical protein VHL09_15395 [Dehalococcoidia bacterium]|nr:hypothetical protein [Dehalococcoidia bacterium]
MWIVSAGDESGPLAPLFEVSSQSQAVELAERLRQIPGLTRVAMIRADDPCTRGILLGHLEHGNWAVAVAREMAKLRSGAERRDPLVAV